MASLIVETYLSFLDSGQRLIVLDTETTGLSPTQGHRLVELACLELRGGATGAHFHTRLNPERPVPPEAVAIHGLRDADLATAPKFQQVAQEFLAFVGEDPLIIHNAEFDLGFLNSELGNLRLTRLPLARAFDTVTLARDLGFERASLDALCEALKIDTSARTLHSALLDCQLLAQVFLSQGFRARARPETQEALALGANKNLASQTSAETTPFPLRKYSASPAERQAHQTMRETKLPNNQWEG